MLRLRWMVAVSLSAGRLLDMPVLPKFGDETVYLGIDPGKSGGLSALMRNNVDYVPMPETETDVCCWIKAWASISTKAVIERVHSSPQMGVASAFTFGQGYGFLRGCLIAAGIPFLEVMPGTWMKALGIPVRKKGTKQSDGKLQLLKVAQQMFPQLPLWKESKSKGRQLAVCDALLIAEYCRRTNR